MMSFWFACIVKVHIFSKAIAYYKVNSSGNTTQFYLSVGLPNVCLTFWKLYAQQFIAHNIQSVQKESFFIDLGLPGDLIGVYKRSAHRLSNHSVHIVPSNMINN